MTIARWCTGLGVFIRASRIRCTSIQQLRHSLRGMTMAVQAVYFSDRDGLDMALKNPETMFFTSKADADARDKVLELAEEIQVYLARNVEGLSDELAEKCAMVIAEDKDLFQKALKKPDLLNTAQD